MCMSVLVALGMLVTGGDGMQPAGDVAPGVVYPGEPVYGFQEMPAPSGGCDCGCDVCYDNCACQTCDGHHRHRFGLWSKHGLPHPRHSTCDMPPHFPYMAQPKFYYYFRPYNWFHIEAQQQEVLNYGGDPRHPYANRFFNDVYEQVAEEYNETRRLDPKQWLPPATAPAPEFAPPQPEADPARRPLPKPRQGPVGWTSACAKLPVLSKQNRR